MCRRVIIINKGNIIYDSPLVEIIKNISPFRIFIFDFYQDAPKIIHDKATIIKAGDQRIYIKFDRSKITAADLISDISKKYTIRDLTLEEIGIDEVIRQIYHQCK